MRNMKKIAALLLTAAMAVSMTGCGGGTKTEQPAGTEAPKTEAASTAAGDAATKAAEAAADAAGVKEGGKLLFCAIENIGD